MEAGEKMSESANPNPEADPAAAIGSPPLASVPVTQPIKRRRRWVRRFAIGSLLLLVVLVLLGVFAPTIISTAPVVSFALSMVNSKLQGTLQVDGLSVSWGGPIEIHGIRVMDPARQQILKVQNVTANAGAWRLITSGLAFGEITINAPDVIIEQQPNGQISLVQAFQMRAPPAAKPASPWPAPQGRLIVKGGTAVIKRAGAAPYAIKELNGQVDIKTLNDISAKVDFTTPDGAKLTSESTILKMVAGNTIDMQNASGTIRVATDRSIKVGPLATLLGQAGLDGGVKLDADANLDQGKLEGRFALEIAGLQSVQRAAANATPLNAQLKGQVRWSDKKLAANLDLSGEAGQAQAELAYQQSDKPLRITAEQVISAMLTGESLSLPDFSMHAKASIDLARLGRTVPELLRVREGVELTQGKLEIASLNLSGGEKPVANAAMELIDVAARRVDKSVIRLAPITLKVDSTLNPGQGLQVQELALASSFAQVHASGSAADLQTTFEADLDQLQRELSQIIDLGSIELAGQVNGAAELKRSSAELINVRLQATTDRLHYSSGGRTLELPRASVTHNGQLAFEKQKLTKVLAQETKVDLNGEFLASASGWYDVEHSGFKAEVVIARGEMAFIASRAKGLRMEELARYSGSLRGQASAERAAASDVLRTHGELAVQNLGVDGQRVAEGEAKVNWDGVELAPDGKSLQVAAAHLESALAQLVAKDVKWKSGDKLSLEGKLDGTADIAGCIRAMAPLAKWETPPELAGRLSLAATGAATGDQVTLVGLGRIDQLVIGKGTTAIREERLQFGYDAKLDQVKQSIAISKCNLTSKKLTAEIAGTIGHYMETCDLDLNGRYSASWEALTALLHELAPATTSTVVVAGASTSEFKIIGPARQSGAQPSFRGVSAGSAVTWTSADLFGVQLQAAQLKPTLKDGQLTLPMTVIPAAGGKVNLGAVIDFQPQEPTLKMAGKTQLLENVAVTKELATQLLSRINPIFLQVAKIEGRINLGVQDVLAPLGQSIKQRGAGKGRLDLSQLKMQPGGFLAELLSLGGMKADTYPVEIGALDFLIKDGRIQYDNLAMVFAGQFDLKFHGSVGFDETVDLVVSVPVRAELLEKLGVKGPVQEYVRMLGGVRVDIPIVGTRENPRLDLSKVDTQSLLKDVLMKQEPAKQIEGILKGLQGGTQKKP